MWLSYLSAATADPGSVSASQLFQYVLGALNLGVTGWLCYAFFTNKLHSNGEMERARADLATAVESARTELARSVDSARMDLLRENESLRTEKHHVEEQRDVALQFAQTELAPLLASFVSSTSALLPILQELTRYREGSASGRRQERNDGGRR